MYVMHTGMLEGTGPDLNTHCYPNGSADGYPTENVSNPGSGPLNPGISLPTTPPHTVPPNLPTQLASSQPLESMSPPGLLLLDHTPAQNCSLFWLFT